MRRQVGQIDGVLSGFRRPGGARSGLQPGAECGFANDTEAQMNCRPALAKPTFARPLVVLLSIAWLWHANGLQAGQLFWHEVRLDEKGKLLSWVDTEAPYDWIMVHDWEMFKNIPVQPDGYRTYFTYPEFNGLNEPAQPPFAGRPWVHNPAGLFAMLTDSAILYYAYSGDQTVMDRVREMLDHMITFGTTDASDSWALVPYASSDAGNLVYRGGTDTI